MFPTFGSIPAAPAEHPDTALFALDREMEEAHARMEQASKVQDEVYRRCTELYPPEPPKWEDPRMSDHLREFIRRHPLAETGERAEYHRARAEKRAAWQASQEAYLEQVEAIDREGGLYPADEAYDARVQELWDIGDRIFATPANTLEGMAIKLRAADRMGMQGLTDANKPFLSIAADIRRLAAGGVS